MSIHSLTLSPNEVRILARCSLHYHFLQQTSHDALDPAHALTDHLTREAIQTLHASGGPSRVTLDECLRPVIHQRHVRQMVERYYHRLAREWDSVIASNEELSLKIMIGRVAVTLTGTLDRVDRTRDGGLIAISFRTETGDPPTEDELRHDHAMPIYHALVAASYPTRRPIRLQELWLRVDRTVTIELSEAEYRRSLSDLRQPIQALAMGQVMARPGWHCDTCPFKHRGCPVYSDLDADSPHGKIPPRTWRIIKNSE